MIEVWFFADDRDETLAMCNTTNAPMIGEPVVIWENNLPNRYFVVGREFVVDQDANKARWNLIIKKK